MTYPGDQELLPGVVRPPSGRFVLRRYTAADAEALGRAVAASLDHLRAFMPWVADEPLSIAARRQIIATWDREWAEGRSAVLGMFRGDEVIGSSGLHRRRDGRPDVVEIGYWVHVDHTRQGLAAEAARALTDAALALAGITAVEIVHDPANVASGGVPAKLGYRYTGEEQLRGHTFCVWRTTRDEWLTDG